MKPLTLVKHPLLARTLSRLRDARTPPPEFRQLLDDAASLLAFEVTRSLETRPVRVRTPLAVAPGELAFAQGARPRTRTETLLFTREVLCQLS